MSGSTRWGGRYQRPAQFGAGPHAELAVHPGQVCFHRPQPHEQLGGDLCVGPARGDQVGYPLLGGGRGPARLPVVSRTSRPGRVRPGCVPATVARRAVRRSPGQPGGTPRPCACAAPAGAPPQWPAASVLPRMASRGAGAPPGRLPARPGRRRGRRARRAAVPGTAGGGDAPPPAQPSRPRLDRAEQGLGRAKLAQPGQRLEPRPGGSGTAPVRPDRPRARCPRTGRAACEQPGRRPPIGPRSRRPEPPWWRAGASRVSRRVPPRAPHRPARRRSAPGRQCSSPRTASMNAIASRLPES